MIHHRQGLTLGFETGDDLAAVHARLDDLESDLAVYGPGLLGHPHDAHAPFTDLLQQFVRADLCAGRCGEEIDRRDLECRGFPPKESPGFGMGTQESLDPRLGLKVVTTDLVEVLDAIVLRVQSDGFVKNGVDFRFFR